MFKLFNRFFEWKRTKEAKQPYYIYFPQPHSDGKSENNARVDIKVKAKQETGAEVKQEPEDNTYEISEVKANNKEETELKPEFDCCDKVETEYEHCDKVKTEIELCVDMKTEVKLETEVRKRTGESDLDVCVKTEAKAEALGEITKTDCLVEGK